MSDEELYAKIDASEDTTTETNTTTEEVKTNPKTGPSKVIFGFILMVLVGGFGFALLSSNNNMVALSEWKDEVYGDGFRVMKAKLDSLGWPQLLLLLQFHFHSQT